MGMIRIEVKGSFGTRDYSTTAETGGHVAAVRRALGFLVDLLKTAAVLDAKLAAEGSNPPKGEWGEGG